MKKLSKYIPKRLKIIWHVKVPNADGFDLTFRTKQDARKYKQLLLASHRKLEARIVSHIFYDNYIVDKDVS